MSYTAVIVEPRQHRAMPLVVKNFLTHLPATEWKFLVMHGVSNKTFVEENVLMLDPLRIQLHEMPCQNLTINDYNCLLSSREFYEMIPTETMLIFQTDALIVNPDRLREFLDYDYVGAPWTNWEVGNGGLSLRKKSKMLERIARGYRRPGMNEDIYFSQDPFLKKPDGKTASFFSSETVFNEESFGIHKAWEYITAQEFQKFIDRCPDAEILRDLVKPIH